MTDCSPLPAVWKTTVGRMILLSCTLVASATAACFTASSGGAWINNSATAQTNVIYTATFDAKPSHSLTNAIVGISHGAQTGYAGFACMVRFNPSGKIDARNGGDYAPNPGIIPYTGGTTYSFRLVINLSAKTYSIYVKPAGGSEQTLGTNYDFRTEQSGVDTLNNYGVYVSSSGLGTLEVCNFTTSAVSPTFSHPAGTHYDAPLVTISSATSGTSIRYTTNGTNPTSTTGTLYSAPVRIDSSKTLKAVAYKTGLTASAVTSAAYTIRTPDSYVPGRADVGAKGISPSQPPYNPPSTQTLNWTTGGTAGAPLVIENQIIYGEVVRQASHVRFVNCLFRGPPARPASETGIVNCHDANTSNWEFINCTFAPQLPNANMNAINGHRFKAIRCHAFWVVDGFGVFTASGSNPTAVEIAGCLVEQLVYFPGTLYSNQNGKYLTTSGTYATWTSATDSTFVKRQTAQPSDWPYVDYGHKDGNHSDGVQIQGAYGSMVRSSTANPASGIKSWTGDGVYVHGNSFICNDAYGATVDPSGLGLPIPFLGFGDNPKRGVAQSPTMNRPATTGLQLFDGGYASNGSAVVCNRNVNVYPYPSTSLPNNYSVVIVANFFDGYNAGLNVPAPKSGVGFSPVVKIAFLYNEFGRNVLRYGSDPINNPQIYPIRINSLGNASFAPADNGVPGLSTNTWLDATNTWALDGSSPYWIHPTATAGPHQWAETGLYWTAAQFPQVRKSGIWYDGP